MSNAPSWFVYMLLCDGHAYYVGITSRLKERIDAHRQKKSAQTHQFQIVELVYCEEYDTKESAVKREKALKGWPKEKKKQLINGELGINPRPDLVSTINASIS